MQYHYVVSYDSVDKTFSIDVDTAYVAFEDGFFFDPETQTWLDSEDKRFPFYVEDYLSIEDNLSELFSSVI